MDEKEILEMIDKEFWSYYKYKSEEPSVILISEENYSILLIGFEDKEARLSYKNATIFGTKQIENNEAKLF